MIEIAPETRLIDLTVADLVDILSRAEKARHDEIEKPTRYVYGMAGIAQLFNCSIATANRIKKSGAIDGAISQMGRTIVCDVNKALKLFNKNQ